MPERLTAEALGAQGDAIARLPDGASVFLPGILPGESVTPGGLDSAGTSWRARDIIRHDSAPDRIEPPCPHFGLCGGCAMQHLATPAYQAWKRGLVDAALTRAGIALPDEIAFVPAAPGERRRMDLALRREGNRIIAGLHQAGGSAVVPIPHCHVLDPKLLAIRAALEDASGLVCLKRQGSAIVNLTESGPDILLRTDRAVAPGDYALFARLARATGAARISWAPLSPAGAGGPAGDVPSEPVFIETMPRLAIAGASVRPPPGAFLQASARGAEAIAAAVLAGLGARPKRIVELYAGIGTLTFPLAGMGSVAAWEGSAASVAALASAAAGRPITARQRDLARQPLGIAEFARAGAIVLDPPHAGAASQMAAIAASGVPRVIYVSCNPASLARDGQTLAGPRGGSGTQGSESGRAGAYRLVALTVIDQFLWSTEVESVAVFARDRLADTTRRQG